MWGEGGGVRKSTPPYGGLSFRRDVARGDYPVQSRKVFCALFSKKRYLLPCSMVIPR